MVPEKPKRRTRKAAAKPVVEAEDVAEVKETVAAETQVETIAEPKSTEPVVTSSESEDRKPKRSGWWQKKGFSKKPGRLPAALLRMTKPAETPVFFMFCRRTAPFQSMAELLHAFCCGNQSSSRRTASSISSTLPA